MFLSIADAGEIGLYVAVCLLGGTLQSDGCLGTKRSEAVLALADIISSEGV